MYFPVLHGTSREGNRSAWLARYAIERIEARGHETRLFAAAELGLGDLRAREWEQHPPSERLLGFVHEMARADGFVLVFPEYNHGYPGALKNMLDHLYDEWNHKPFAFVTAGGVSGGLRAQENLVPVIRALKGVVVSASVAVPFIGKSFNEDGPVDDEDAWARRFETMLAELEWWAEALTPRRRVPRGPEGAIASSPGTPRS